ncbi:MAG: TIGR03032 family protein [Cyanobacteria bacterium SID2]|nr:TIGR03032 family protein [Cyanobacteria bacterium SID2]MBP0005175.1 TIGR03032 family protein [Cyanobacteria bacterium SBC]
MPDLPSPQPEPLRSVHTTNFPQILKQLGISLVVSTYQAGKLIVLRADGDTLNTHFRVFDKPMGVAVDREKLAIGSAYHLWELRNVPPVSERLEPPGKHDACYLPRKLHVTGDIDIHEMAYTSKALWFINTRFSCLCTLDSVHSFVPRWRPPFVSAYELTDRCHLNGLGLRDDRPRYVTALGATDSAEGWRKNKANGGILMDIETDEILVRGLSMPHSPRWYLDRLWVLESGCGSLATVDLPTGQLATVAELPGFTRGIDFYGDLAFIGLSQIRETAIFSGIPIARQAERYCGVWVVNIMTGETVAFLRFEDAVREIFAVQVLPGIRFPEVIENDRDLLSSSYVLPDAALAEVKLVRPEDREQFPEVHFQQGNQSYERGELEAAISSYQNCLNLDPNHLEARYNLGVALADFEQRSESIEQLLHVVENNPQHTRAFNQLGVNYARQNQLDRAIECYETAVSLAPDYATARYNLGMTRLQQGDYLRGFAECEWRWKTDEFNPFDCPHPYWKGESISDKTLLVHTEQGAGDAMQFARFLPLAARRCKRLILVCPQPLQALFQTIEGVDDVWLPGSMAASAFDTYIPLMSLPHALRIGLDTLPTEIPYLKAIDRSIDLPPTSNPKVGIVWAGSPTQGRDRDRSCSLNHFLPVLENPNLTVYSLQKGDAVADLANLPEAAKPIDLGSHFEDFADTAAAIEQLDLVISVDTSVAHLAGALGKPVWTLLCYSPDWRWMLDRADSPWYPTMRLFRQTRSGDWEGVFRRVGTQLTDGSLSTLSD